MKTYNIYFRHYDRVLSVKAHHFSTDNGVVTFYADETETNSDIYIAFEAVGAIEAEDETPVNISPEFLSGGNRNPSSRMGGF